MVAVVPEAAQRPLMLAGPEFEIRRLRESITSHERLATQPDAVVSTPDSAFVRAANCARVAGLLEHIARPDVGLRLIGFLVPPGTPAVP